jgi:hypothetical protein
MFYLAVDLLCRSSAPSEKSSTYFELKLIPLALAATIEVLRLPGV